MRVIIVSEKHGDRYLKASTPEEIQASAYKILCERWEDDWYLKPDGPEYYDVLPPEECAQLPAIYRVKEEEKMALNGKRKKNYMKEMKEWEAIKSEVESPAGRAFALLRRRGEYEYEGVEIVDVEE